MAGRINRFGANERQTEMEVLHQMMLCEEMSSCPQKIEEVGSGCPNMSVGDLLGGELPIYFFATGEDLDHSDLKNRICIRQSPKYLM